jgi:sugar phosphate isomerase/epimerase
MNNRRNFLKNTGILAASLALSPSLVSAFDQKSQPIGIQLYTLRDIINKDIKGIINQVAKAGFKEVETYGYSKKTGFWGLSPQDFEKLLNDNGLKSPSGHFDFNEYLSTGNLDVLKQYIEASEITKTKYIVCPYISDETREKNSDYRIIAEKLNKAGELFAKSGIKVGYHNHGFEFDNVGGRVGLETLLAETDQNLVTFELDLYWAVFAKRNPIEMFEKYPNRFSMWHVKDMNKQNKDWNTEIGNGTIDYKAIFTKASLSGVKHIFVEQENNYKPSPIGSINNSIKYIKKSLL